MSPKAMHLSKNVWSEDCLKATFPLSYFSLQQLRNNFCLQREPSERYEVIPMLCKVKRLSSRETQSESAIPLTLQRLPRGEPIFLQLSRLSLENIPIWTHTWIGRIPVNANSQTPGDDFKTK